MLVGAGRASVRLFCFSAPDLSRRIPPFRIPRRRDVMHTTPKFDRVRVAAMAACAMLVATTIALVAAHEGGGIAACVNSHSGELRIVGSQNCPAGSYLLQWNERGEPGAAGPAGPAGPPGPAGSGGINVQYHWAGMYP